jgi:hypothetical protein
MADGGPMIAVGRLAPGDQWDCNMLDRLFANDLYPTGIEFERHEGYPNATGMILIIPGRYWAGREQEITEAIRRYEWVLAIRTSDEEDSFDIAAVRHPNVKWWVQTPRTGRDYGGARFIGLGFPWHFDIPRDEPRVLDVFLSAQDTHGRRHEAFAALDGVERPKIVEATDGFTKGMPPSEYARLMSSAKIAPAPAGAVSPDTFRVYEALQAHAVPIADDISPAYNSAGYWSALYPDAPFPILSDYKDLPGYIGDSLADYPKRANRIAAWWVAEKRRMARNLADDLAELNAPDFPERSPITVLVTCSPIPSHPSAVILEETIYSVRAQLPDAEIVLTFDGVRPEQEHRRGDYELFIQRALWLADHVWGNVLPLISDEHLHQAVAAKRALEHVRTPLMLFVEHDTPLTGDIPWPDVAETILAGDANVVRMHHEASILAPHRYLMLDDAPQKVRGVPMMRTVQWSQRPHLASVAWYRDLLDRWFPNDENNFIEDVVYGRLITAHERDGDMGWMSWRTWIYTPDGDIRRSYHTDGRAGEDKFDG